MNEQEKKTIEAILEEIGRKRQAQQFALMVLRDLLTRYAEARDLVPMLFALRDALNLLLRDMPLGEQPEE